MALEDGSFLVAPQRYDELRRTHSDEELRALQLLRVHPRFRVIALGQPVPLFRVMGARGFAYSAEQAPSGHWEVLFEHTAEPLSELRDEASSQAPPIEIDARGLEPPMPMVRILEVLETLPCQTSLIARTDRRPVFLLDELPRRGFRGEANQTPDGTYITQIQRRP